MTAEEEEVARLAREGQQISAGERMKEFLADPAIRQSLLDIEKRYFEAFRTTDGSPEALNAVWAKNRALQDLLSELATIKDAASLALHARSIREAQEARTPRKPR